MTNVKDFDTGGAIEVMKVGGGLEWSSRMMTALERISTTYVMYFQEDYWISSEVDTAMVDGYVALMDVYGINYLRLLAKPLPDSDFAHDDRLGVLADDAPYRTSVQITLWRREVFLDLLRRGESVWEFEVNGTERSRKYGSTFLSVKRHGRDDYYHGIRYVCTAVNYGKWSRMAPQYARAEGLEVDFRNLPTETWWDEFKRYNIIGVFVRIWLYRARMFFSHPGEALKKARRRRDVAASGR